MSEIIANTELNVKFTEDERHVLARAMDIINNAGVAISKNCNEDIADRCYEFYDAAEMIENLLKGI